MSAQRFLDDLYRVPEALSGFADAVQRREVVWPVKERPRRMLLVGMGSSFFAAGAIATRLRALGLDAVAELASAAVSWPASPDLLVVAISASGGSSETLGFVERHAGVSQVVALTNVDADGSGPSPLAAIADETVHLLAGPETGGVACRSYRHTIAALSVLEARIAGGSAVRSMASAIRRAAAASAHLLDTREEWLVNVIEAVDTPDGVWFLAPNERFASAQQSALMVREGPRRRADACETGDWSHVDVYLTKTLDYRAVVFTGSAHEPAAADWMRRRGSVAVGVGPGFPGAGVEVRYPGQDDPLVALLTEVLVGELLAATWWSADPAV